SACTILFLSIGYKCNTAAGRFPAAGTTFLALAPGAMPAATGPRAARFLCRLHKGGAARSAKSDKTPPAGIGCKCQSRPNKGLYPGRFACKLEPAKRRTDPNESPTA